MDNAGPYGNIAHIQESSFIFGFKVFKKLFIYLDHIGLNGRVTN